MEWLHIVLDLVVQLWDVGSSSWEIYWSSECSKVNQSIHCVSLEGIQEVLGKETSDNFLISSNKLILSSSHLQVSSINFITLSGTSFFKSLCLHQFSFFQLQETSLMFSQNLSFIFFDDFNSGVFNRFTNQDLQNWLDFIIEIKEFWIPVHDLDFLIFTSLILYKYGSWWSINVIVRLNIWFISEVFFVIQCFPKVWTLHLSHLDVLLLLLLLLMPHFFLMSAHSHFLLSLFHISLINFLLLNECGIRLHINRDNQCCESITTHNTAIIHEILRCHLTIKNKSC